jgi:hypothetical protein
MNKLKKLGFKKVPGTEPGFHMYELTPARLQAFDSHFKPQAASNKPRKCKNCSKPVDSFYHLNPLLCNETSNKPQAASNKRLDKVK